MKLTGDGDIPEELVCVAGIEQIIDDVDVDELSADDRRGVLVAELIERAGLLQGLGEALLLFCAKVHWDI